MPTMIPIVPDPETLFRPVLKSSQKTVLVIDDSRLICEVVADALMRLGYATLTAYGRYGFDIGQIRVPDLILLDLNLEETDGGEMSRQFKTDLRTQNVPIVIMTGSTVGEACARGVQADGYLPKPFDSEQLGATVAWYLGHARNRTQVPHGRDTSLTWFS